MVDRAIGDICIRSEDGVQFKIVDLGSGGGSSVKVENLDNGRIHWVSRAGLKRKYTFLVPWTAKQVD